MRDDIDFREKYISSLEEQIDMYRGQHHHYCLQIQKLKDNIHNLEEQLIESKKRKLSSGSESSEHVDDNRLSWSGSLSADLSSRPLINRASISLPINPSLRVGSISSGRTLPPFSRPQMLRPPIYQHHSSTIQELPLLDAFKTSNEPIEEEPSGPACDGCRLRKRKCGREKPSCTYCVKLKKNNPNQLACSYPNYKKTMTLTEKRLRALNGDCSEEQSSSSAISRTDFASAISRTDSVPVSMNPSPAISRTDFAQISVNTLPFISKLDASTSSNDIFQKRNSDIQITPPNSATIL